MNNEFPPQRIPDIKNTLHCCCCLFFAETSGGTRPCRKEKRKHAIQFNDLAKRIVKESGF